MSPPTARARRHRFSSRSADVEDGPADVVTTLLVLEDERAHRVGEPGPLPRILGQASGLPFALGCGCHDGLDGIRGRTEVMLSDVADTGRLPSSVGSEPSGAGQVARGTHRVATDGSRLHHRQLTGSPGARRRDRLTGSAVIRAVGLEEREDVLGTVGCPQRQELVVGIAERAATTDGDESWVPDLRQDHEVHTRDVHGHHGAMSAQGRPQFHSPGVFASGYAVGDVDAFLDEVFDALASGRAVPDIAAATFSTARGKSAYAMAEVDAFLDDLVAGFDRDANPAPGA